MLHIIVCGEGLEGGVVSRATHHRLYGSVFEPR